MKTRALMAGVSFFIGCFLCFCAIVLTGFGHGTYAPLALCASPTILLATWPGDVGIAFWSGLFLAPCYWVLLAMVATARHPHRRSTLIALLFGQYVGAGVFQWWSGDSMDRIAALLRAGIYPFVMAAFAVLYLAAEIVLWQSVIRGFPHRRSRDIWTPFTDNVHSLDKLLAINRLITQYPDSGRMAMLCLL